MGKRQNLQKEEKLKMYLKAALEKKINNKVTYGQQYPRLELCGRSLVWSRTSACHADDPGSNLGDRTKTP